MYEYHDIEALLEKYWEGESTIEEERLLKGYFAQGEVDERLAKYAPLFKAIREEQAVQLQKAKVVPVRPQMYQWAAAASLALLLSAGLWWFSRPGPVAPMANTTPTPAELSPKPDTNENIVVPQAKVEQLAEVKVNQPRRLFKAAKARLAHQKIKPVIIDAETEAAMAEIKAALALVSSKIKKGRREAAKSATHLEAMDKIFKKREG